MGTVPWSCSNLTRKWFQTIVETCQRGIIDIHPESTSFILCLWPRTRLKSLENSIFNSHNVKKPWDVAIRLIKLNLLTYLTTITFPKWRLKICNFFWRWVKMGDGGIYSDDILQHHVQRSFWLSIFLKIRSV